MKKIDAPYLIIGNSTAAVACIEGIRSLDPEGPIALLSREERHTYSRPLISYLLGEEISEDRMYYRAMDFYKKNNVRAFLGCEATKIDAGKKTVHSSDGREFSYEKLLIATGGTPITPDIPGMESEGVFHLYSWKDAEEIRSCIRTRKVKKAVVLGGGLIGIKATEALLALGVGVELVELAGHVLVAMLDESAAGIVHKALGEKGVRVHCNTTVSEIRSSYGAASGVTLDSGVNLPCELVIPAIGVKPDTALAGKAGIETDRGILVDEGMRTGVPDIFAAGDVTQGYDRVLGVSRPIAIFPGAFRQGRIAGVNMAGGGETSSGNMAMNSVSVCGVPTISVGMIRPVEGCREIRRMDERAGSYKKIILRDGRVVGAMFVKEVDRAGIYTGLIRSGVDVSEIQDDLATDDFGLLRLPREYRKYVVSGTGIEL